MSIETMKLALEAMESVSVDEHLCNAGNHAKKDRHGISEPCPIAERFNQATAALRAAIEQAEKQEPVAYWRHKTSVNQGWDEFSAQKAFDDDIPLYTAPPQREWQGLTDEEFDRCDEHDSWKSMWNVAAMLKEKNSG